MTTVKTARAINAELAQSLSLFEDQGTNEMISVRSADRRVWLRVMRSNAQAVAQRIKTAHQTYPRGRMNRVKEPRTFPKFEAGMSTRDYVTQYMAANQGACHGAATLPYDLATLNAAPCTLYAGGALDFDAIEEPNDDQQAAQAVAQVIATATTAAAIATAQTTATTTTASSATPDKATAHGMAIARGLRAKIDANSTDQTARASAYASQADRLAKSGEAMSHRAGCQHIGAAYRHASDIMAAWGQLAATTPTEPRELATVASADHHASAHTPPPAVTSATTSAPTPTAEVLQNQSTTHTKPSQPSAAPARTAQRIERRHVPIEGQRVAAKSGAWEGWIYKHPTTGAPALVLYRGKSPSSWQRLWFKDRAALLRALAYYAAQAERRAQEIADRAAMRRADLAKPHSLAVGDVLYSSWGYEQTNVNFYEVTALRGKRGIELRELAQESTETSSMQGQCVPLPGNYKGQPLRRVVGRGDSVNVMQASYGHATKLEILHQVNGVRIFRPKHWSSYA